MALLTKQWSRRGETLARFFGLISPRGSLLSLAFKMPRDEAAKGEIELRVFDRFVRLRSLNVVPGSIEKRTPREPDIRCVVEGDGVVGFELTEACAPEFAAAESLARREGIAFAWGSDDSENTIRRKLQKSYSVTYPIELILWAGRTALPDDVLEPMITPLLANGIGQFRRVWLLGDELLELSRNAG